MEFDNVTKVFGKLVVLKDLSFKIADQDKFVVLLGPSGCGKSTVLKLISGLLQPDQGHVRLLPAAKPDAKPAATVPQAYTCFPWLTAKQNVAFGLVLQNRSKAEQEREATRYLQKVGLTAFAGCYPKQLSGGMQQRVAIARTLAVNPQIVLMDEPFGALDAQTREEMQKMLCALQKKEESTVIFVTHDITEAVRLANRIMVFGPSPTGILPDGDLKLGQFDRWDESGAEFTRWSNKLRDLLRPTAEAHAVTAAQ